MALPTMAILLLSVPAIINQIASLPPMAYAQTQNTDKFGIKKLYPTKTGGEEWYMDMLNPTSDRRFNPGNTITKNSDGSWKMTATQVRMGVYPSTGYDASKIATYDHSQLATKGYMQASNDWKNIEMTGYVKVNAYPSDDNFAWYNRGGRHTDSQPCEGVAYKGDLYFSGKTRFAKEQWHVSYVFTPYKTATDSIKGEWVGFKYVVYNFVQNGKTVVKMENWLDKNNDGNWVKIDERIDSGGWGSAGTQCRGAPDQIISWGGPIATFRWDTATNVDFKNLSVREIQTSTSTNQPPAANAGPDQTVAENTAGVTLNGGSSTDSDGTIASYSWVQTAGSPTVTLTGANTATPTFTAPSVTATTTLTFRLTVTDNSGATATDDVSVVVTDSGGSGGQTGTCENLPLTSTSITASGDDGVNKPANTIDNNLNTRWSHLGIGRWIQADLGAQKTVCSVDIAWYAGNARQYNFVISVSTDGTTFTNVQGIPARSTGTTLSAEKYDFADVNARYVKITVNGNTANSWAAITEIDVFGGTTTSTATNQPPTANAGPDQTIPVS